MLTERWTPAVGFPRYAVSNFGRVRNIESGRMLVARPASNGYPRVTLSVGLGRKGQIYKHVHWLICEAFHGPSPSPDHEVAHRDGTRANNREDNLRWATFEENMLDKQQHLRAAKKLTEADALAIRVDRRPSPAVAASYGVAASTIKRIRNRRIWAWL